MIDAVSHKISKKAPYLRNKKRKLLVKEIGITPPLEHFLSLTREEVKSDTHDLTKRHLDLVTEPCDSERK